MSRRTTAAVPTTLLALMIALVIALAGCSSSSTPDKEDGGADVTATTTTGPAPAGAVAITFKGSSVTPSGEEVKARVGTPVTLFINADTKGEIHVHSTPEQHVEYPAGTSTVQLTFAQPGVVEIESHTLDKQIVQVQVR